MRLKKKILKIQKLAYKPSDDLPWFVKRVLPDIEIGCTGISLSMGGDFVSTDEAIEVLEYLIKELK